MVIGKNPGLAMVRAKIDCPEEPGLNESGNAVHNSKGGKK